LAESVDSLAAVERLLVVVAAVASFNERPPRRDVGTNACYGEIYAE